MNYVTSVIKDKLGTVITGIHDFRISLFSKQGKYVAHTVPNPVNGEWILANLDQDKVQIGMYLEGTYQTDEDIAGGQLVTPSEDSTINIGFLGRYPVSGLIYKTPTLFGLTNPSGMFLYRDGESIEFQIGYQTIHTITGTLFEQLDWPDNVVKLMLSVSNSMDFSNIHFTLHDSGADLSTWETDASFSSFLTAINSVVASDTRVAEYKAAETSRDAYFDPFRGFVTEIITTEGS